ncbi:hypothetical protein ACL9RF_05155 [Sphingobacterium sp. Mn56C]|uniref:hypothetical protein n=1 Tax=Sphingobacterium sp. Mn56C TaxID=3395261 RepID=UPI003BDC7EC8
MKNKQTRKRGKFTFREIFLLFNFVWVIYACNKEKEDSIFGPDVNQKECKTDSAEVYIQISGDYYADEITVTTPLKLQTPSRLLTKNFKLSAELVPVYSLSTKSNISELKGHLPDDMQYKVAVFDADNQYIGEKNYTYKKEWEQGLFSLPVGKEYIFIIYAVGSRKNLPDITFKDDKYKTLGTAELVLDRTADFVYCRTTVKLPTKNTKIVPVELQHKFSEITTTIDARKIGELITQVNSNFSPHYNKVSVQLNSGQLSRSKASVNAGVDFLSLNAMVVTSLPTRIHADENVTYNLSNLVVGKYVLKSYEAYKNLKITPGIKYKLNLVITP